MIPFFNNIFPSEVVTFVSRCPDDFSLGVGQNDLTDAQKQFLSTRLDFDLAKVFNVRQVHGNKVVFVPKEECIMPEDLKEADGMLTDAANLPLLVRSADCVPIFLYGPNPKEVGLLHAGWRGTHRKILLQGLKMMHSRPEDIKIAFGPAIRECCYEIGTDVREYFSNDVIQRQGKCYLDLVKVNANQAINFGVRKENILDCEICSCCDNNYFSYRREGNSAGRMISLMMLR